MRRALAKRLIPLLMVLVLVIPYFAVSYYDVYGDDKQNLNDANSKKKDLQSQYEQTEKIIEDLKAQNDDMIAYIAKLDAQMSSVDGELNEVNEQVEQIEAEIADTDDFCGRHGQRTPIGSADGLGVVAVYGSNVVVAVTDGALQLSVHIIDV